MKIYELMHLLSQAEAGTEVRISACLTVPELTNGVSVDDKSFCLTLKIDDFDPTDGCISTYI